MPTFRNSLLGWDETRVLIVCFILQVISLLAIDEAVLSGLDQGEPYVIGNTAGVDVFRGLVIDAIDNNDRFEGFRGYVGRAEQALREGFDNLFLVGKIIAGVVMFFCVRVQRACGGG